MNEKVGDIIPLRRSQLQKEDLEISDVTDEFFLSNSSEWEEIFSAHTGSNMRALREHLLNILDNRVVPDNRRRWYVHRWRRCLFDSISPKFFLMTEIYVPTGVSQEKMNPFLKEESVGYIDIGRHDVSYLDLSQMTWGLMGNSHLIREKLNGVHVEKVTELNGQESWHMLGMIMPVEDSPTELLEWTAQGMFGLYPYGVPRHYVNGVEIKDHKWQTPTPLLLTTYEEGVMILQGNKEVRLKRVPTIETLFFGDVWETGMDSIGIFRVRPRYGREPSSSEYLNYLPTMNDLELPHMSFTVNYTVTGPYTGKTIVDDLVYTIDSGYRMHSGKLKHVDHGIPVTEVQDVLHVERIYYYTRDGFLNSGPVISEKRSKAGVKAVVFDENNVMYLIKDEGKPYDYVGGTVAFGESTVDCLIREIWEETGSKVTKEDLVYVGISTGHDKDGDWHTYMYLLPSLKVNMTKFQRMKDVFNAAEPCQLWVLRLMLYVGNTIGNACIEYYLSHTRVALSNPTTKQMKMVEGVISSVMTGKLYFTGPDLMHAIYKCAQVETVDFSVLKVILSTDFRVIPYINVMCDHSTEQACECTYVLSFEGERRTLRADHLVGDVVSWILYVSNNYGLVNGVPHKLKTPNIGTTVAQWAVRDSNVVYHMTDQPSRGVCGVCFYTQTNAYWFVKTRRKGTLCPKCYVRLSQTLDPEVIKVEPGPTRKPELAWQVKGEAST